MGDGSLSVTLTFAPGAGVDDASLTSALARKISRAQQAKNAMNALSWSAFAVDIPRVLHASHVGTLVENIVGKTDDVDGKSNSVLNMASIRGLYEGLADDIRAGIKEVETMRGHGVSGDALETMMGLLLNGIA